MNGALETLVITVPHTGEKHRGASESAVVGRRDCADRQPHVAVPHSAGLLLLLNEENGLRSEALGFGHLPLYPKASQGVPPTPGCILPHLVLQIFHRSTQQVPTRCQAPVRALGILWWKGQGSVCLSWSLYFMTNQ